MLGRKFNKWLKIELLGGRIKPSRLQERVSLNDNTQTVYISKTFISIRSSTQGHTFSYQKETYHFKFMAFHKLEQRLFDEHNIPWAHMTKLMPEESMLQELYPCSSHTPYIAKQCYTFIFNTGFPLLTAEQTSHNPCSQVSLYLGASILLICF